MSAGDDDPDRMSDEELARSVADEDPETGPRQKRNVSEDIQLLYAEYRRRSKGLTGDALQREVERLLDLVVETHVRAAPPAMWREIRARLTAMRAEDPTLGGMIENLRAAAAARAR